MCLAEGWLVAFICEKVMFLHHLLRKYTHIIILPTVNLLLKVLYHFVHHINRFFQWIYTLVKFCAGEYRHNEINSPKGFH